MKHFQLPAICMALMLGMSNSVSAKDIFISATGNDANDGLTAATALATLAKAATLIEKGDVIHVSGFILEKTGTTLEGTKDGEGKTINGAVTIVGTDPKTDGFNLEECDSRLLFTKSYDLTFQNLTIKNGYCDTGNGGGALYCEGGTVKFDNCILSNNATDSGNNHNGGAYRAQNVNTVFNNCELYGNAAFWGGAAEVRGGTFKAYNTLFSGNNASGNGGALGIIDIKETEIKFCTFKKNLAGGNGGALNIAGASTTDFKMLSSAIIENTAGSHAGAFSLTLGNAADREYKPFLFGSCTFSGNMCQAAGGVTLVSEPGLESQEVDFVNCTITGNHTANNIGNSAGINMQGDAPKNKLAKLNIINTILEGNWSDSNNRWTDGWWKGTNVNIKNSIVGFVYQYDQYLESYVAENSMMWTTPDGNTTTLASGIVPAEGMTKDCYPLVANSDATTMGNIELAAAYGVTVDQKGTAITKPYIGAVQLLQGEEIPIPTAIKTVNATERMNDNSIYSISGQRVGKSYKGLVIKNGKKYIVK